MPERHGLLLRFIAYIGTIVFFMTILLAVYAPVIRKDFFYAEDHKILGIAGDPAAIRDIAIKEGRIVNAFMGFYLFSHARSSESVKTMRLVGIIGMALFASVMWAILKRFRFRSAHALLMSALICTLPCSQLYVLSTVCINFTYGALLSSLSALIVFNVIYKEENKGRTYEIIGLLIAIILLVISFTIYQPAAMMYWAIGIIFVLAGSKYDFIKKNHIPLIKYYFVGLISIALYYLLFIKIMPVVINMSLYVADGFSAPRSTMVPIHKIPVKLIKFLIIPFNNAINLWNVSPRYIFSIFASAIIIGGIKIDLIR